MQPLLFHNYKNNARNGRLVVTETVFAEGMTTTDNPLPLGQCSLLVNVIAKDQGERVRPRGAWVPVQSGIQVGTIDWDLNNRIVHHVGTTFITYLDGTVKLQRYAMLAHIWSPTECRVGHDVTDLNPTPTHILIEEPYVRPIDPLAPLPAPDDPVYLGTLVKGTYTGTVKRIIKRYNNADIIKMHDMLVQNPKTPGFFGTINGNTYLLGDDSLYRLVITNHGPNDYRFNFEAVTPFNVTPSQAFNYGYNMLKTAPYTFANNNTGALRLHGVLPYDPVSNALKLQARVGEALRFKLVYDYNVSQTYKVRWEIQDIYARDGITAIQTQQQSPSYTNGAEIALDYVPPYKQFSVIVTVFLSTDLVNPLKVITLASFHLADDVLNPNKNESKTFNLKQAKGMMTWKNRLVFWGVPQAELAIFLSDTNDPTYVPFPNNVVEYGSKVLKCLPYEESLLVVTENAMYLVDNAGNGAFTSKPIQTNLQLRAEDIHSIFTIRNMICFKSRNYYYMVVPNRRNEKGEMQIAPVSMPITGLLDNFKTTVMNILVKLYAIDYVLNTNMSNIGLKMYDYQAYADGARIRYVYTMGISVSGVNKMFVDFHLIYDTTLRTWTTEIVQTNGEPMVLFQSIATGYAQFLNIYYTNRSHVQWVTIVESQVADSFVLGNVMGNQGVAYTRILKNHQLIDTGKRDLGASKVKRLREIILEFNNVGQDDLHFNHVVSVDDEAREDLFQYNPTQIIDPQDPKYGMIYIERTYTDGELIPAEAETIAGVTALGQWSLGNSSFPESSVIKAHLPVTGKGYYPRLELIVKGDTMFDLNHISWVYRDMGSKKGGRNG